MLNRLSTGLVAITIGLVASACAAGAQNGDRSVMMSERLIACETLIRELRSLDYNTAPEEELSGYMRAAAESEAPCQTLWEEAAESEADTQVAAHQARQFRFQALLIEGALSARFDEYAGYCEILDDTLGLLFTGLSEIEASLLDRSLEEQDHAHLAELRDLDAEALDVLLIHREENCAED